MWFYTDAFKTITQKQKYNDVLEHEVSESVWAGEGAIIWFSRLSKGL